MPALASLCLAGPAIGQTLRGVIIDRASGSPLSGITVVLLDSANRSRASALSDQLGKFIVDAPSAGVYRLRLDDVAVLSETTLAFRIVNGDTLTQRVPFERRFRDLPPVMVNAKPHCVPTPDGGVAVAALWDEVRKALAATEVSKAESYHFDLLQYERELDPRSKAVRRSRTWEGLEITGQPYESIAADSLATYGFVRATAEGTWYYAPDAQTLLADAFVRTHCLKPVPTSSDHPGLVGLAFEPIQKRAMADVRGVLWLDAATSKLRFLDYRYTNLPRSLRDIDFGGRVEFERLPNGAWVVERWNISMPRLSRQTRSMPSGLPEAGPARLVPVTVEVVIGIIEHGGEVKARSRAPVAPSARVHASIRGSVFDSTANGPLAQAEVWLDAPGQTLPVSRTLTDSAGNFRVDSIAPGNYSLTVSHLRLDALGSTLAPVFVNLERGQSVTLAIATPSLSQIVRSLCPAGLADDAALMRGVVLRATSGTTVPAARVVARWQGQSPETDSARRFAAASEVVGIADESGHFTLCGLPRRQAMVLAATDARSRGEPLSVTLDSERIAIVNLFAPEHSAEIKGIVTGRDGRPIPLAEIRVVDADIAVRSDSGGAFSIQRLAAGKHALEAKAVGYAPLKRIVDLRATVSSTVDFRLDAVAQVLKAVKTVASRDRYRTGFHDRMTRNTGGQFLTNERIRKSGLTRVTDLLQTVPGLQVRMRGNVSVIEFTGRGGRTFSSHGCPVAYAIDGVPYEPASFGLDGEIGVENIEAIEVYDAATAPAQYSRRGTGCGVILIWTREKSVEEEPGKGGDDTNGPPKISSEAQKENEKKRP